MAVFSLATIAEKIGATLQGSGETVITGVAPLQSAKPGELSFLDNLSYKKYLTTTKASAVILAPQSAEHCLTVALIVANPYLAYAKAAELFVSKPVASKGIHPTAIIDPSAQLADTVSIGAYTIVGANVVIGEHTVVGAHCYIGDNSQIGAYGQLAPRVSIYQNTHIGQKVIIHSGAVIAADGFGYANDKGNWCKVPQLGGVEIGNEVEIGANTCIDRGALNNTRIGNGVKLDNLIQIGHNVVIGDHTAIAACAAIAGSTKIGSYCMIGGASGIGGHLEITDRVLLTGKSMVTNSIKQPGIYSSGTGSLPNKEWRKNVARFRQLDNIVRKLNQLERRQGK
jgi:UDP-3-O-[3-hydroxymyristoyl] glucosamine N-acyltransferase